jgi:hypothetical protein
MRRLSSIAKATALEILSEPLSLLVLISAIVLSIGAPALHYHQFGDATRMARDAGFSALFTCGTVVAVVSTVRSFRREIETGTMAMALASSVSRVGFFAAKTLGALSAYLVFAVIVSLVTVITVNGAKIGGEIAEASGGTVRLWGPSLAIGFSVLLVPLALSAVLNRFFRVRFVLSAFWISLAIAAAGVIYRFDSSIAVRFTPAFLTLILMTSVFLIASGAFSVRFASNIAIVLAAIVVALSFPFVGNYYLVDALDRGGSVSWTYVALAALALLPAATAFFVLGAMFARNKEVS